MLSKGDWMTAAAVTPPAEHAARRPAGAAGAAAADTCVRLAGKNMINVMRCCLVITLLMLLYVACDDDSPVNTKKPGVFEGILVVELPDCHIVGGDTTDFQPRPKAQNMLPTNYSLKYACPNPTIGGTWVYFQIPQQDSVWLFVYDKPGGMPIDTLYAALGPAGAYSVDFENKGSLGIYRVVMHAAGGFESYGDVEFKDELP